MQITIRAARTSDIPALFHIRTSVQENHLSLERLAQMGITIETVSEMIVSQPCAWVAEMDGMVVGFSMIAASDASIFACFVHPKHEGKGIGKQLILHAEQRLFEDHATIWLETNRHSRAAGFYRHLGWLDDDRIGENDIRLIKMRHKRA